MYTLLNRASFSEVVALAFMPWGLWAIYRYRTTSGLAYAIGTALIVAATLLTHLFSAYVFIANLLLYVLALSLTDAAGLIGQSNGKSLLSSLLRLSWPLVLGLGLAAFVWLPALWEADYVQRERVLLIADPTTGQGLVPPWQVFTLTGARSTIDSVVQVPPRLSLLAAGLALWGVVSGLMALRSLALKGHLLIGLVSFLRGGCLYAHAQLPLAVADDTDVTFRHLPLSLSGCSQLVARLASWCRSRSIAGTSAALGTSKAAQKAQTEKATYLVSYVGHP